MKKFVEKMVILSVFSHVTITENHCFWEGITMDKRIDIYEVMDYYHSDDPELQQKAVDMLIESLSGYINYVINKEFPTFTHDREALYNEAVLGILEHLKNYDPKKSSPTLYFRYAIIHNCTIYIDDYYNESTSYYRKKIDKVLRAKEILSAGGYPCTNADIAAYCGITEKSVEDALIRHQRQAMKSSELEPLVQTREKNPLDILIEKETKSSLEEAIQALDEIEQKIIYLRFYEDESYQEISKQTGISTRKVQSRLNKALRKMSKNPKLFGHRKTKKKDGHMELDSILLSE